MNINRQSYRQERGCFVHLLPVPAVVGEARKADETTTLFTEYHGMKHCTRCCLSKSINQSINQDFN